MNCSFAGVELFVQDDEKLMNSSFAGVKLFEWKHFSQVHLMNKSNEQVMCVRDEEEQMNLSMVNPSEDIHR